MNSLFKNLLTLLALLAIGGLGYYLFVIDGGEDGASIVAGNEAQIATDEFLHFLDDLKGIDLEGDLFADPRFRSFVEFTEPLPDQSIGRENPFAAAE